MPKIEPFEKFPQEYEAWFKKYSNLYDAEIEAIRKLLIPLPLRSAYLQVCWLPQVWYYMNFPKVLLPTFCF